MTNELRLGWTRQKAVAAADAYRRLLAFNLVLQVVLGLTALTMPDRLSSWLGLAADATGWLRAWGFWQIAAILFYVPGWLDPVDRRWPNLVGVPLRLASAVLFAFLGGGFLWLALFDAVFALALAHVYWRLLRAELMSRP
jgi:hypothetical protein